MPVLTPLQRRQPSTVPEPLQLILNKLVNVLIIKNGLGKLLKKETTSVIRYVSDKLYYYTVKKNVELINGIWNEEENEVNYK